MELNQERLKKLDKLKLKKGNHTSFSKGACVMEMVAYIANEPWSDRPECACPTLTSFAITLNDRADDETRQLLKPLIPKLIGTRDGGAKERAHFLIHHSITVTLPILVGALDLNDEAKTLREFKSGQWNEMRDFCRGIKEKMRAAMKSKLAAAAADYAAYAADYAYAAYAAAAAAYAADAAKKASKDDNYLLLAASLALETLRELKSPGCELLEARNVLQP